MELGPLLGFLKNIYVVLEGKTGKEIPESSRSELLEKFSANNFAISDVEDNTCDYNHGEPDIICPLCRTEEDTNGVSGRK